MGADRELSVTVKQEEKNVVYGCFHDSFVATVRMMQITCE